MLGICGSPIITRMRPSGEASRIQGRTSEALNRATPPSALHPAGTSAVNALSVGSVKPVYLMSAGEVPPPASAGRPVPRRTRLSMIPAKIGARSSSVCRPVRVRMKVAASPRGVRTGISIAVQPLPRGSPSALNTPGMVSRAGVSLHPRSSLAVSEATSCSARFPSIRSGLNTGQTRMLSPSGPDTDTAPRSSAAARQPSG